MHALQTRHTVPVYDKIFTQNNHIKAKLVNNSASGQKHLSDQTNNDVTRWDLWIDRRDAAEDLRLHTGSWG